MKRVLAYLLPCLLAASLLAGGLWAQSRLRQVELELVLALDTSLSIDAAQFELQKQGVAAAFRHPDVLAAIESCGGAEIAVALVQWSGNRMHLVAADWALLRDPKSAEAFAAKVAATSRLLTGFTFVSDESLGATTENPPPLKLWRAGTEGEPLGDTFENRPR